MSTWRVRVPATIANLGPGLDTLGLALGLYLEIEAQLADQDAFHYQGQGSVVGTDNLIHQAFRAAHQARNIIAPPINIRVDNSIPLARGLGSSSAALVAGAALADLNLGGSLGRQGVLEIASRLEGHPDNVAPAVLGGLTVSALKGDVPVSLRLEFPQTWHILVAIPEFELATKKARAVLPAYYSKDDVIYNLSRAALFIGAVANLDATSLQEACRDRLHQPYRAPLIPKLMETIEAALQAGASAAFLAGAGPSLATITTAEQISSVKAVLNRYATSVFNLHATSHGYSILDMK